MTPPPEGREKHYPQKGFETLTEQEQPAFRCLIIVNQRKIRHQNTTHQPHKKANACHPQTRLIGIDF
jgi:hypothetical protein